MTHAILVYFRPNLLNYTIIIPCKKKHMFCFYLVLYKVHRSSLAYFGIFLKYSSFDNFVQKEIVRLHFLIRLKNSCHFRDMIPVIPGSGMESNFSQLFSHSYSNTYTQEDVYSTWKCLQTSEMQRFQNCTNKVNINQKFKYNRNIVFLKRRWKSEYQNGRNKKNMIHDTTLSWS